MKGKPAFDIAELRSSAREVSCVLKALAHGDRLLLLCEISQGELSVGELAERLDIRQPTLSQQLGVLRREGLVNTRRQGKQIYYRIADAKVLAILKTLYELYCGPAKKGRGQ